MVDQAAHGTSVDVVVADDATPPGRSVQHLVGVTVGLGVTAVALAFALSDGGTGAFKITWLSGVALATALVALTTTAELVAVRVRHGDDAVEELTLLDGVVLLNTLVLPIRGALLVSLAGLLLAYILRRRPVLKMLFNLGVYATASSATAALVTALTPASAAFDAHLMAALVVGSTAFVVINLAHMSLLLAIISDVRPWQVVREDGGLSVLTIMGTTGLTGTVLVLSVSAPALLPCAVLPAVALRYAYRATAERYEQRRRSGRVLDYSHVLASGPTGPDAVAALLRLVHEEFAASVAVAVFSDGTAVRLGADGSTLAPIPPHSVERHLLEIAQLGLLRPAELPSAWQSGMAAPIVAEGRRMGTIAIGTENGPKFRVADLTTLSPLVSALAVALQNSENVMQLVEETSKLRAVVDQAGDGIVVLGRNSMIQVWSPAMERITGVAGAQVIGARFTDVLNDMSVSNDAADTDAGREAQQTPRPTPVAPQITVDVRLRRPDGEKRSTQFSHAALFQDGTLVRDVVIVRDLTAEWRVQRMKSDFIATVSHELRTPLTPLMGYASLLRERGDLIPADKRQRALDVIMERASHLARLVEDLLAASSIDEDEAPMRTLTSADTDLAALVSRAVEDFASASTRIRIEAIPDVVVTCDPTRALQVAGNLISNALKYSDADTTVLVAIDRIGPYGRLVVTDHGHGIPTDDIERIFDKFHRVEDPMIMSTGGTGLGLFIARHLARAMKGDLTAESTLGVGSQFFFTLPIASQQPEP